MTISRDLGAHEPWQRSIERSQRRRAITPQIRRRVRRRRRTSAALTTLMVAGPAGQALAASGAGVDTRVDAASPATRAIDGPSGAALLLKLGSAGPAVTEIQQRLGASADGAFGPATDRAVRDFQLRSGLDVDGIVGPATWTKLFGLEGAAAGAGAAKGDVAMIVREQGGHTGATVPARGGDSAPGALGPDAGGPAEGAPTGPVARVPGTCGTLRIAAPVNGTVTSSYGPRGGRNHDGMDISAPTGTPVRAAECGVVSSRGVQGGYGNMVCVKHSSRFETCYAHLSRYAVSGGEEVRKGQVVGYVGCTGSCTGPHVHFETRVDGRAQDPSPYLKGRSVPGEPAVEPQAEPAAAQASSEPRAQSGGSAEAQAQPAVQPQQVAPAQSAAAQPQPAAQPAAGTQPAPAAQPAAPAAQPAPAQAQPAQSQPAGQPPAPAQQPVASVEPAASSEGDAQVAAPAPAAAPAEPAEPEPGTDVETEAQAETIAG